MKKYKVETTARFDKELKKLDKYTQKMILSWIVKNIDGCTDPRAQGKALKGDKSGLWRYRVGDYRVICNIEEDRLVILALTNGRASS